MFRRSHLTILTSCSDLCLYLVCTLPLEYCEYSPTWDQCRANLEQVDPELLAKLSALRIASGKTEGKSEAKAEGGSTDGGDGTTGKAKKDGEEGSDEDEAEEAPAKPAAGAGKAKQEIHLVVKERTRRKFITIVKGVETCGLVAKEVAKLMAKKFATSASPGEDVSYMTISTYFFSVSLFR